MRIAAVALLTVLIAFAQNGIAADLDVSVRFSSNEILLIRDFYQQSRAGHGGGGKEAKQLPPGIAKNLARGKPLPPGIAKRALPDELTRQLPPVPAGYERIIVAGKILLVEIATQVVHDILTDVILD